MVSLKNVDLRKIIKEYRFFFLFLIINVIAHWKILLFDTQLAYGDLAPWPESLEQSLKPFLYSWIELGFGVYRQSGNLISVLSSIFLLIFRSPLLSQKVYIFSLSLVSYLGMNHFLKNHLSVKSEVSRFLPSLFYTFCPVALGEFTGGTLYSTMLVFSLLPYLYSNTLKLLSNKSLKLVLIQGLFLGVIFSLYIQFVFIFFLSLVVLFFYDLINTRLKSFFRWWTMVYAGIIAILFNPIVFLTATGILINKDIGQETRSFVDSAPQFLMEISLTYDNNPLSTISRLGSIGAFGYKEGAYWSTPFLLVIISAVLITTYFQVKKRRADRLAMTGLLTFLLLVFFIFATTKEWTFPIFRAIPFLFMFRNPAKLVYLATFFFAIIYAYSLQKLSYFKINKVIKILIFLLFLGLQIMYTWPAFVGDRGLIYQRENYRIPPEYIEAVSTIKTLRQDDTNRTSWIPIGHEATFIKLVTLDTNKLDAQIGLQEFGGAAFERTVLESLYFAFFRGDQNAALKSLRMAQVDYLVVFKDEFFYKTGILNQEIIKNTLEGVPIVDSNEHFDIYQIGTNFPLIFSPQKLYSSNISDTFYSVSKIKTDDTFALIPLDQVRELHLNPDDFFLFINHSSESSLVTNTTWSTTWDWKKPAIYPKIPGQLTPQTDLYSHTITSLESLAETTNYLIYNKNPASSEIQELTSNYSNIINFFNLFLTGIPEDKIDNNILNLIKRIYLYVDRSYLELEKNNLINENILSQYQTFVQNVNKYNKPPCEFDYCYNLGIRIPATYQLEIFDIDKNNKDGIIWIDNIPYNFQDYADNNWINVGMADLDVGSHVLGFDLYQEQEDYILDEENNTITITNDENIKYSFTFLYDFQEDVFVDIYNIPSDDSIEITDKYLVWKGHLAAANSHNFCYVQEGDKCYRIFVANLQPNNNYESVKVTFHNDISTNLNSKNVITDIKIKEQLIPVILLRDSSIKPQPRNPPDVTFKKINPTKYEVYAENITEDFLLVFNQSYNNNWALKTKDGKVISSEDHFKSNFFANTWFIRRSEINEADNLALEIVFEPQKQLYLSFFVSLTTIIVSSYIIFIRKEPQTSS